MTNDPIDNAFAATEGTIEIDLICEPTGATYAKAAFFCKNTMQQIVDEYGPDIGVNPHDSRFLFKNKRTGTSTSDANETVEDLDLQEGDVLAITIDCWMSA